MIRKFPGGARIGVLQLVKYYAVGGFVNAVGYLLFLMFVHIGIGHKLVASALYVIGVIVSFCLNRKLVFDSGITLRSGLARLFLVVIIGYILNISTLYLFVDIFKFNPGFVQLVSVIVVSVYFYLFNKFFVHKSCQA